MWFSEFVFLERSWAKDENTLRVIHCVQWLVFSFVFMPLLDFVLNYVLLNAAVRFSAAEGLPKAIMVGSLCGGNSLYEGKAFSCSRICSFKRVANS